jgi:DNA repair protein RecO (recombination protein O)
MLQKTRGIVLRAIKYGDTSLICSIFTEVYGVQSYMMQGVRSTKAQNRAGLLQPATLLDMVVYHKPQVNLHRAKEYHPAYIYQSLQEHVVKNSVALFSAELLLRLLPEQAPQPELFELCFEYFSALDKMDTAVVGNFPLYFIIQCSHILGYNIIGSYSTTTPHLNLHEGGFTSHLPVERPFVSDEDAVLLSALIKAENIEAASAIEMNGAARFRLLDWYIAFMHRHTQHMGEIRSLQVLRAILH